MEENQTAPKIYKFYYSKLMIAVMAFGIVLCCACFALTTWQFTDFLSRPTLDSVYEWLKFILLYFVSIFLAILFLSMLIRSRYIITQTHLVTVFGIIRSKYDLKKIRSVCLLNGSKKLCLYFDDYKTNYMTIVVRQEWYDDFIKTITARNEKIGFDFSSAEDEEMGKKKK